MVTVDWNGLRVWGMLGCIFIGHGEVHTWVCKVQEYRQWNKDLRGETKCEKIDGNLFCVHYFLTFFWLFFTAFFFQNLLS